MDAARIIEALGDTAEVAAAFGASLQAVSNWKSRGLPRSRLLDLHQLAQSKGRSDITPEVIRAAVGPHPTTSAA